MSASIDDLITAAAIGRGAEARAIVQAHPELADGANMFGARPTHAAVFAGHAQIAEDLFAAGVKRDGFLAAELNDTSGLIEAIAADPCFSHRMNAGGMTALHLACYWCSIDAARILIDAGADVMAVSDDGFLEIHPLGSAVATPNIANPSDDETNVIALVDLLLRSGADVNARRRDGLTALHTAGYRGNLDVIRRLLKAGADPTIRGRADGGAHAGMTPAHLARSQNQEDAARLIESGRPPTAP